MRLLPVILGIPNRVDWEWLTALLFMAMLSYPVGFAFGILMFRGI